MKKLIVKAKYELKFDYFADDSGHIWSDCVKRYLTEYDDKNGYKKVVLTDIDGKRHRFSVHRLIMETFCPIEEMNKFQVDHIDGIKAHNQLSNLRWATVKENLDNPNTKSNRRVYDQEGTYNALAKFNEDDLNVLILDINSGEYSKKEICDKYKICYETLSNIITKKHYKDELRDSIIVPNFKDAHTRPKYGENNPKAKLKETDVLKIINLLKDGHLSYKEIGDLFHVSDSAIYDIRNKKNLESFNERY